jgi:hypothetical protein
MPSGRSRSGRSSRSRYRTTAKNLVVDYLWGRSTGIFLGAIDRSDAHLGSERVRLLQAGEMAGSSISLPGSVLRSTGLEVLGLGTGTMPPPGLHPVKPASSQRSVVT